MRFPAYALVVVALVGLSFRALRLSSRPRSVTVAAVVNLLTFLPAGVLLCMHILGMSPTVQFNVYSSIAMQLFNSIVAQNEQRNHSIVCMDGLINLIKALENRVRA